ncbi:MAG: aspartate kinase [Bdellovibrionales bacterium]
MNQRPIVVRKYGGVCLESPERIRQAAQELAELARSGHSVVVVVSAMGKSTDALLKLAYETSPRPNRRELDMLLTTGERVSMALMSMALSDLNIPAISFTGSQAGVMTNDSHSQARLVDVRPIRVREELARGKTVVLAGFQGVNPETKEITTLGRGGSDTTAVAMACALKADRCEIVKEVDGVCSADPRVVSEAQRISRISYGALAEMCFWGAKVLHYRSVELARRQRVKLWIKRWGHEDLTTETTEDLKMEESRVLAVSSQERVEHASVVCEDLNQGLAKFSSGLKAQGLAWPQILAATYEDKAARFMITSDREHLDAIDQFLRSGGELRPLGDSMSAVTVTCEGAVATDLVTRLSSALTAAGISAHKCLLTSQSITFLVKPVQRESAIRTLHGLVE